MSLGVNVGPTHTKRSPGAKEILMLVVTGQSFIDSNLHNAVWYPVKGEELGEHDGQEVGICSEPLGDWRYCWFLGHGKKKVTPYCAPRRLLATRAIGGCSLASDDLASGSHTVLLSSRVARPQDASEALFLVSHLSSSARSHLDTYKLSEVADMETIFGAGESFS